MSTNFSAKHLLKCKAGCVATSQKAASEVGIQILNRGGNAADAAVAIAAALNVTEPCSTGLGGDAFCLYFDNKSKTVCGINASGRSPKKLTLQYLNDIGYSQTCKPDIRNALNITVPGACSGWIGCVKEFGSGNLTMKDIFAPAIVLARDGFVMTSPVTHHGWENGKDCLVMPKNDFGKELLIKDEKTGEHRAPKLGELFKNPGLAAVFESIAEKGSDAFYKGWVADAIVDAIQKMGGVMTHEDLAQHTYSLVDPISIEYKGYRLWEIPPNSQGIVALEALNILKNVDFSKLAHNSTEYIHTMAEALRFSFEDALKHCADPEWYKTPVQSFLNEKYGSDLAKRIGSRRVERPPLESSIRSDGDTVYFSVVDAQGNACSFINSTYMGFGTGIVPKGCGFSLQNRGCGFSLNPGDANIVEGGKRPYHTIIPAMLTDATSGDLVLSYGVMGGFMQPQGHVQVLLNMLEYGMDPQEALDAPRFLLGANYFGAVDQLFLEEGINVDVINALKELGHNVSGPITGFERSKFGRGQVVATKPIWQKSVRNSENNTLWAGSDLRADGAAIGC